MNIPEYLIFRHSISRPKYRVPIDYTEGKLPVSPEEVEKLLQQNLTGLKYFTCFVSGGLDSSTLAAMSGAKVIYTASFPGFENDESDWAKKVARHIGAELRIVEIDKWQYLASLEYLIRQKGDGLHPNEPCLYLVAKQAHKDGFSTILSGEGADDIFGGYTDLLTNGDQYLTDKETFLARYAYVRPSTIGLPEDIPFKDFKKWGMERFILEIHTPGLIERAQNACRAAEISPRFPYLEGTLPQTMWNAPTEQKDGKNTLKKMAEKYLPLDVIYRPKIGFPVPLKEWMGGLDKFLLLNTQIWKNI